MSQPGRNPSPDMPSRLDRVRYHVDLFMSWSPLARFAGLFMISAILVSVCAALALLVSPGDSELSGDFLEAMWWALIRVVDSGGMADDKGSLVRLVAVMAMISGVMVVALLIGLVSSTMGEKIDDLRKGKSPIIDSGHTLILGYSDKIFPILRELREANASQRRASIVVLSPRDKIEVEDAIRDRMGGMRNTRVVVRQGSSFSPNDLRKAGAGRAKSIIILSEDVSDDEDDAAPDADMNAIKTLLALRRVAGALVRNHAVVELAGTGRVPVIERLGGGGVEVVAMRETLARLMVQTARQTGLANVYRGLLGFDGAELYLKAFPELAGRAFGEAQAYLRGATLVGVRRVGEDGRTKVSVNPKADLRLAPGDELLVLAEDDDSFGADPARPLRLAVSEPPPLPSKPRRAERILICGYRSDLPLLLRDFDAYTAPGSELVVMPGSDAPALELGFEPKNVRVSRVDGDPTDPECVRTVVEARYDSVLLVANDSLPPGEADARTVIALLMLREGFERRGLTHKPRMVSEILDPRTTELVSAGDGSDFVVSSEITSMLLAQVAEQRDINLVYNDLFDPDGSEIYLKSVERYAPIGAAVSWASVQAVAARYDEIAIGCYRHGVEPMLNPNPMASLKFLPGDKVIVLAEDEREEAAPARQAA